MGVRSGIVAWLAMVVGGCGARAAVMDYRVHAVVAEQDWGDRLHVERAGVRVLAGPVAVFPYARGEGEVGRYQLYTRVMVENVGLEPVEVEWSGAELEGPGGWRVRLVASGGAGGGGDGEAVRERLGGGERSTRALLPETLHRIGLGEPLVPLCDGCAYRMVIPVIVEGRRERFELWFELKADRRGHSARAGRRDEH